MQPDLFSLPRPDGAHDRAPVRPPSLHVDGGASGFPVVARFVQPGQVWETIPSRTARRGKPRRLLVCAVRETRQHEDGGRERGLGPDTVAPFTAEAFDLDTGHAVAVSLTPTGSALRRYRIVSDPNVYRVHDRTTGDRSTWGNRADARRALHSWGIRRPWAALVLERTVPLASPLPEVGASASAT